MKLKKDVEALQQKCEESRSKAIGGDSKRISSLEKTTETLRRGLAATVFLSHQKKEHAQIGELHRTVDSLKDELVAWEMYFQQQPNGSGVPENICHYHNGMSRGHQD